MPCIYTFFKHILSLRLDLQPEQPLVKTINSQRLFSPLCIFHRYCLDLQPEPDDEGELRGGAERVHGQDGPQGPQV